MSNSFFLDGDGNNSTFVKNKGILNQLANIATVKLTDFKEGVDDTTAFENMVNYINSNYLTAPITVLIPHGIWTITRDIQIDNWTYKNIQFVGSVKFTNCNALVFRWLKYSRVTINQFIGDITVADTNLNTLTKDGLKLINCQANKLEINKIDGFRNALWLHGQDYGNGTLKGTFANEINFRELTKSYNPIYITDTQPGWVNENTIIGGSIYGYNGVVQGTMGETSQTSGRFHNNKFINIEFENIYGGDVILLYQGRSNVFAYPRFEGGGIPPTSKLINEGSACALNLYLTSNYTVEVSQIILNTIGTAGSKLIADIRNNTTRVATEMLAEVGEIKYFAEFNSIVTDTQNNTLAINPREGVMLEYKTRTGGTRKLLSYSSIQTVEDVGMLNTFSNFTNTSGSTYSKLHYYITGENELVVGGFIKCSGTPANDTIIHTLPTGFKPITRGYFTVGCDLAAGYGVIQIEVSMTDIVFRRFLSGTAGAINRMSMNGIRLKLDIPVIL